MPMEVGESYSLLLQGGVRELYCVLGQWIGEMERQSWYVPIVWRWRLHSFEVAASSDFILRYLTYADWVGILLREAVELVEKFHVHFGGNNDFSGIALLYLYCRHTYCNIMGVMHASVSSSLFRVHSSHRSFIRDLNWSIFTSLHHGWKSFKVGTPVYHEFETD